MSRQTKAVTLNDLKLHQQNLAIEAVGVLHGGSAAVQQLQASIVNTTSFIASRFNSLKTFFSGMKPGEYGYYHEFATKWKYLEVKHAMIHVPDGFKGNLNDYAEALLDTFDNCSAKLIKEVIEPFDLYISKLINNPLLLGSQTFKHSVSKTDIEKYRKNLVKFTSPKKVNSAALGDVFARMLDLENYARNMESIRKHQELNSLDNVKKAADKLNANLNQLIDVITDKTNNITLSQKVIDDLSSLTLELAKQVEFYAVVDHLIVVLTHCTITNINTLKRVSGKPSNESIPALELPEEYSQENLNAYLFAEE